MASLALAFDILARDKGASKTFDKVGDSAQRAGRSGSIFGSAVSKAVGIAAGALAGAGLVDFFRDANAEARESQKVGALTAAVIKSTGGAAKITAAQVGDLATAISNKTGIDDEAVQSGANMLLTFKNLRNEAGKGNDIFNQSTKTLIDMASAMGTDPKQAAIQLGKALNDPIKGITALSRVGVTFTEGQKKQIKALVESGKTMDAQKIILKELNSEFGGAAAAQATAGDKAKVAWANFKEGIGTALLPLVDKVATGFTDTVIPALNVFFGALSGQSELNEFDGKLRSLNNAGIAVREWVGNAVGAIKGFVTEFQNGTGAGGKFHDVLDRVAQVVRTVVTAGVAMVKWMKDHERTTLAAAAAVAALVAITRIHAAVMAVQAAGGIIKMIQSTRIVTALTRTWAAVQWLMNAALTANPIGLVIVAIAALVAGIVIAYKKSETFRSIVDGAFKAVGAAAKFMWEGVIKPVFRFLVDAWFSVVGALVNGAASAFGWVPGLGPKLKAAAAKFNQFRDSVNAALNGTQNTYTLHVITPGMRETIDNLATLRYQVDHIPKSVTVGVMNKQIQARALGGPVSAGMPYIVGERRPELFVPSTNGRIVPSVPHAADSAMPSTLVVVDADGQLIGRMRVEARGELSTVARSVASGRR